MKEPKNPVKTVKPSEIVPHGLRDELEQSLKDVVQNKSLPRAVDTVVAVLSEHTYNESKLPSAFELSAIEEVVEGGARQAIEMAREEQAFVMSETAKNNRRGYTIDLLAPILGLCALLSLIGLCVYMVYNGDAIYAAAVVAAIGASAAIFFRPSGGDGNNSNKKK